MKSKTIFLVAAFAIASPATGVAQAPPGPAAVRQSAGPTVAAATVGVRPTASAAAVPSAAARERRLGAGQNVALMVVGGAALVIGAIIGGGAGLVLAVGGAIIGLYGLYNFVQ